MNEQELCDAKSLGLSAVDTVARGRGVTGRRSVLGVREGSKFFIRPEDLLKDFMIVSFFNQQRPRKTAF